MSDPHEFPILNTNGLNPLGEYIVAYAKQQRRGIHSILEPVGFSKDRLKQIMHTDVSMPLERFFRLARCIDMPAPTLLGVLYGKNEKYALFYETLLFLCQYLSLNEKNQRILFHLVSLIEKDSSAQAEAQPFITRLLALDTAPIDKELILAHPLSHSYNPEADFSRYLLYCRTLRKIPVTQMAKEIGIKKNQFYLILGQKAPISLGRLSLLSQLIHTSFVSVLVAYFGRYFEEDTLVSSSAITTCYIQMNEQDRQVLFNLIMTLVQLSLIDSPQIQYARNNLLIYSMGEPFDRSDDDTDTEERDCNTIFIC